MMRNGTCMRYAVESLRCIALCGVMIVMLVMVVCSTQTGSTQTGDSAMYIICASYVHHTCVAH